MKLIKWNTHYRTLVIGQYFLQIKTNPFALILYKGLSSLPIWHS